MRNVFRFDNEAFNKQKLYTHITNNSSLKSLTTMIQKLDSADKGMFKHVLYGNSTSCAKLLCGVLEVLGYKNVYDNNHKVKTDPNKYYAFLTQGNVYQKPLSRKTMKEIKQIFNNRPSNIFGEKIRFIVIDHYYKEGLDLFDTKYMHIFSKIPTQNEEKQIVGRVRRMCGHIGLPPGEKLYVYSYYTRPETDNTFPNELTKICYYASVDFPEKSYDPTLDNIKRLFMGNQIEMIESNFGSKEDIYLKYRNIKLGGSDFKQFRNNMLIKYPELSTPNKLSGCNDSSTFELSPTQQFIKDYFKPNNQEKGMLLWHSTGSGKTCTGLGVASTFAKKGYLILWVTRSSLVQDIYKNLQNCYGTSQLDKNWIRPMSYKTFTNMLKQNNKIYETLLKKRRQNLEKTLLIIDEAHKLFDNSLSSQERPDIQVLKEKTKDPTCHLLLMTATPFMKEPMDLMKLLNLLSKNNNEKFPEDKETFTSQYLETNGINFTDSGARDFIEKTHTKISYLDLSKDISRFAMQVNIQV